MEFKRDKIISLRVRSDLYNKANLIINQNTRCYETYSTKKYYNALNGKYRNYENFYRKFSIADLLEIALEEFIKDNTAQ